MPQEVKTKIAEFVVYQPNHIALGSMYRPQHPGVIAQRAPALALVSKSPYGETIRAYYQVNKFTVQVWPVNAAQVQTDVQDITTTLANLPYNRSNLIGNLHVHVVKEIERLGLPTLVAKARYVEPVVTALNRRIMSNSCRFVSEHYRHSFAPSSLIWTLDIQQYLKPCRQA